LLACRYVIAYSPCLCPCIWEKCCHVCGSCETDFNYLTF
jgi:hypothetical protein